MAKILIVEDEKAIADLIAMNLEMVGHETVTAGTGAAAKRLFREYAFDLLLLDVMLPDGTVYELHFAYGRLTKIWYYAGEQAMIDGKPNAWAADYRYRNTVSGEEFQSLLGLRD